MTPNEKLQIEERIVEVLKTVYDPEIPVDIYNLGLIYNIDLADDGLLEIDMTLTAPNCPAADFIMEDVRMKTEGVEGVKAVRDATRGGVNAVLHEFAQAQKVGIQIDETVLPIRQEVRGICELLGLDALNFANEGKLVIVADKEKTAEILTTLRSHPLGENAAVIGEVTTDGKVRAVGLFGQSRLLDLPRNEPLPRIC